MASLRVSTKRLAIDKDQARIAGVLVAASVVTVFCFIGSGTLLTKMNHQRRVISALEESRDQVVSNVAEVEKLKSAYNNFEAATESVIGDTASNSKVVLDALPSKYDYAALLTSMESILRDGQYDIAAISGTDEELTAVQSSPTPEPIEVPLTISVNSDYAGSRRLIDTLNSSIRPFNIKAMRLSGDNANFRLSLDLVTYYQPTKEITFGERAIK